MKKQVKQILCLLLAIMLMCSTVSTDLYAAEIDDIVVSEEDEIVAEEVEEEEKVFEEENESGVEEEIETEEESEESSEEISKEEIAKIETEAQTETEAQIEGERQSETETQIEEEVQSEEEMQTDTELQTEAELMTEEVLLAEESLQEDELSGSCGENMTWRLDSKNGTLHISGSGDMTEYGFYEDVPWYPYHESIKSLDIKNGIKSISQYAFFHTNISEVVLPYSIEKVDSYAFAMCEKLTRMYMDRTKITEISNYMFHGCKKLSVFYFPNDLEKIGNAAFAGCEKLNFFNLPEDIISIGIAAFAECKSLTEVSIPEEVEEILAGTFSSCENLVKVTIPDGVTKIDDSAFSGCDKVVIIAYSKSYAQEFAKRMGITFRTPAEDEKMILEEQRNELAQNIGSLCVGYDSILAAKKVELSSIELPENWKWVNPKQTFIPRQCVGVQYFEAKYIGEEMDPFKAKLPVDISVNDDILPVDTVVLYEHNSAMVELPITENVWIPEDVCNNSAFTLIDQYGKGKYVLGLSEEHLNDNLKNKSYKVKLHFILDNRDIYKELTIKIEANPYAASVKQISKPNVFYNDSSADLQLTSKGTIDYIDSYSNEDICYEQIAYDAKTGIASFYLTGVNEENTSLLSKKKKVPAIFEIHYVDSDYVERVNFDVSIEYKKPSLSVENVTFLNEGMRSGYVHIFDAKTKESISDSCEIYCDNEGLNASPTIDNKGNTCVQIYQYEEMDEYERPIKPTSFKLYVTNSNWNDGISVTGKISYAKKLTIKPQFTNPVLNIGVSTATAYIPIDCNKKDIINDNALECELLPEGKLGGLIEDGILTCSTARINGKDNICFSIDADETIKPGTYKVKVRAGYYDEENMSTLVFNLNLTKNAPKMALKVSKKIDLVNREESYVEYKPSFQNMKSYIADEESISLSGDDADFFYYSLTEDGNIRLKAKSDIEMSHKKTYYVEIQVKPAGYSDDTILSTAVKIKVDNKLPKITHNVSKVTLNRQNEDIAHIVLKNNKNTCSIANVERVEDKNSKYFSFESDLETSEISVSLTEEGKEMKKGTYAITYRAYIKDASTDAAFVTNKISVIVK